MKKLAFALVLVCCAGTGLADDPSPVTEQLPLPGFPRFSIGEANAGSDLLPVGSDPFRVIPRRGGFGPPFPNPGGNNNLGGNNFGGNGMLPAPHWQPRFKYQLPGEFERQQAIVLGCHELARDMPDLFAAIVDSTGGRLTIVALVNDEQEFEMCQTVLKERNVLAGHVRYAQVLHNTMWARDYGPLVVRKKNGRAVMVDADYSCFDRFDDDCVPTALGESMKLPVVRAPLLVDGGNLLSNGQGLCIATYDLLDHNVERGWTEDGVRDAVMRLYGGTLTVFLKPLIGEPTGHIDMFATFTAPNTVVVAKYDAAVDPDNAAILDDNASTLAQIRTQSGPLRVVRVPMPARDDGNWRTYTNVSYANGTLMVPIYPGIDLQGQREALATFAQLLPGWQIVPIDAEEVAKLGGALHCVTMNLGPLAKLPEFPVPRGRMPGNGEQLPVRFRTAEHSQTPMISSMRLSAVYPSSPRQIRRPASYRQPAWLAN